MEPALKQRLLGAAVLVALAVTFLPLLVMDPAPASGAADVPLDVPEAPEGDLRTVELSMTDPASPGSRLDAPPAAPDAPAPAAALVPAPAADGDYAVSFGAYATAADAERVVGSLRASQLAGYQEQVDRNGRSVHRVRIGPFASQADAEAARLRAAHVRDDVGARVVVLDAAGPATGAPVAAPAPSAPPSVRTTDPQAKPAATPAPPPAPVAPAPAQPPGQKAAAGVGFAVQLGAFANSVEAEKVRDRARAAGFPAFVEQVRTDSGTLSRVRIGPVADRAEADRMRIEASGKLGIDGFVRPHP